MNPNLVKIIYCLIAALIICVIFRCVFAKKRELWFARTASTIFNQRGALGSYLSLGYPKTWQGALVTLAQFLLIVVACALIWA
ncbi:MAG: hypothetical protein ROM54_10225 [Anaerobiospirillum sp.]|nr:hypothetical protein [Anaerobiospirillum sp.]